MPITRVTQNRISISNRNNHHLYINRKEDCLVVRIRHDCSEGNDDNDNAFRGGDLSRYLEGLFRWQLYT